jgi:hypothetical protein
MKERSRKKCGSCFVAPTTERHRDHSIVLRVDEIHFFKSIGGIMLNMSKVEKLNQNLRTVLDSVIYEPGVLSTILGTILSQRGGALNVAREFGLAENLDDTTRQSSLLTKLEQSLGLLTDEALIKRNPRIWTENGITRSSIAREDATYSAS